MKLRKAVVSYLSLALGCWLLSSLPLWAADQPSPHMTSDHAAAFAVSPPLRDLAKFPAAPYYSYHLAHEVRRTSIHPEHPYQPDAVEQNSPGRRRTSLLVSIYWDWIMLSRANANRPTPMPR